ncbi:polysaccharide deacetylase family protein [Bittarella massiliensis (ex Durand et al. 2017)]|uniref:polysaccharide deacetylase family protein n=1 Tax=Bittarella massiliensis (ex Durand et al. 2017) TaxID=1720313 RepID=UPI001AA0D1E8|nr:polysaccharide deacetylase family protein [Bittarella massiliensis (ex Durand et al. 2017)]MBO1679699.1 polysaccharide deacetylase [Bittarella massiliensis (ex Durand et al. 2017)]
MKCYVFRLKKRMLVIPLAVLAAIGICVAAFARRGGTEESRLFPSEYGLGAETLANAVPQSESGQKVAYLTFDDGPSEETEKILDALKERDVKATFFVLGTELEKRPDTYKRIVGEGHVLGLHSFSHEYKEIYASPESFWNDLDKLQKAVTTLTGQPSTAYRFPGGSSNTVYRRYSKVSGLMDTLISQLSEKGLSYYDWTVSAEDAVGSKKSADYIVNKVVKEALKQDCPVILMHDGPGHKATAEAIPRIVDELQKEGYSFATLSDSVTCHHSRGK